MLPEPNASLASRSFTYTYDTASNLRFMSDEGRVTEHQYDHLLRLWALTDHLGSVRDVIEDDGTTRLHQAFDSFGRVTDADYFDSSGASIADNHVNAVDAVFEWQGHLKDESTGLLMTDRRPYDPDTGGFASQDPSGFPAGYTNLYVMVGNKVTTFTDPMGLAELPHLPQEDRRAIQRFVDRGIPLPKGFLDIAANREYLKAFQQAVESHIEKSRAAINACTDPKLIEAYRRTIARQINRLKNLQSIARQFGGRLDGPLPYADMVFFILDQKENKYEDAQTVFSPRIDLTIEFMLDACSFGTFSGIVGPRAESVGRGNERREENLKNQIILRSHPDPVEEEYGTPPFKVIK